jgi:N-formylglutamate deformylase
MGAGWNITKVGDGPSPLVVHVPHSATWLPGTERSELLLDDAALDAELRAMTDWHTDRIAFDALASAGIPAVVFANTASRILFDPERFVGDDEPMLAVGMGAVYQSTSDRQPLRLPDPERDQRLMDEWFHPYSEAFTDIIDKTLADHGRAVIVDLHSFPSKALPYELDQGARRPDICLGTDPFHTSPAMLKEAREIFEGAGWDVEANTPFAGSYVPLKHLGRTREVTSIMIEIRRDLYQLEPGGPLHAGCGEVVERVSHLFRALAERAAPTNNRAEAGGEP